MKHEALVGRARPVDVQLDRCTSQRIPLHRGALLELTDGTRAAVNLLDLSDAGAAIAAVDTIVSPGASGNLVIDTVLLPITVVEKSDGRVHLSFQSLSLTAAYKLQRLIESLRRLSCDDA